MKHLTKAEEEVMQVLWQQGPCFVKEIIPHLPNPKTAYNTVSTIVRILEDKGFVGHETFGRSHRYFPLVTKAQYRKQAFKELFAKYFDGSYKQLASFFTKEEEMDEQELEQFLKELEKRKTDE